MMLPLAGVLQEALGGRAGLVNAACGSARLAPATALGIARLARPCIGLVCTLASTAASLRYVILSYLPGRQIDVALIDAADDGRNP
jgi:hypothetical protein